MNKTLKIKKIKGTVEGKRRWERVERKKAVKSQGRKTVRPGCFRSSGELLSLQGQGPQTS
jgi:hypothetical protein